MEFGLHELLLPRFFLWTPQYKELPMQVIFNPWMNFNSSIVTVRVSFGTALDASCGPQFESVKSSNSAPLSSLGIVQHPCNLFSPCLNQIPCDEVCFKYHKTYLAASIWPGEGLLLNWLSKLYAVLISGQVFILNQFKQPIIDCYSWI